MLQHLPTEDLGTRGDLAPQHSSVGWSSWPCRGACREPSCSHPLHCYCIARMFSNYKIITRENSDKRKYKWGGSTHGPATNHPIRLPSLRALPPGAEHRGNFPGFHSAWCPGHLPGHCKLWYLWYCSVSSYGASDLLTRLNPALWAVDSKTEGPGHRKAAD